jgi:rhodanese-related sulfurtransferase
MEPTKVTAEQARRAIDADQRVIFLDVRSEPDWVQADRKLPGAIRVPADQLDQFFNIIPQNEMVVPYCACPGEESSTRVARTLLENGWTQAHPLLGGFDGWRNAAYPLEPR